MTDITVLVVDRDDRCRTALVDTLRRLGMRALGVVLPGQAAQLLDGIDAEATLVKGDSDDPDLEPLRDKTPLLIIADRRASIEDAVLELLRALGRPEAAARLN